MKKLVLTLFTGVVMFVPLAALAQVPVSPNLQAINGLRAACFSPQRAFSESADGKAVIARLAALQTDKARAVDEKNRALRAQEQALQQSGALLNEATRLQRTNELEKFRIDVQRFIQDAQAELMGVQREVEDAFVLKLKPAVAKVAQAKNLDLVFNVDDEQIAWFDPKLDITAEVVKQLDLK